jgi:hypothetical protein
VVAPSVVVLVINAAWWGLSGFVPAPWEREHDVMVRVGVLTVPVLVMLFEGCGTSKRSPGCTASWLLSQWRRKSVGWGGLITCLGRVQLPALAFSGNPDTVRVLQFAIVAHEMAYNGILIDMLHRVAYLRG